MSVVDLLGVAEKNQHNITEITRGPRRRRKQSTSAESVQVSATYHELITTGAIQAPVGRQIKAMGI